MKFSKEPIILKKGDTVTSLYHSPFDYHILYLVCLGKTGLKIRLIFDDIDNLGVDRSFPTQKYIYTEKYFLSKTERTNIRPLTLTIPKHLFANLSYPALKKLETKITISRLKSELGYLGTVEHWIRDVTEKFGALTLVGPDKAFAFSKVDRDFINSINQAKEHLISLLSKLLPDDEESVRFIEWLFDTSPLPEESVSDFYIRITLKIIERFNLEDSVTVERMSDRTIQNYNDKLFREFINNKNLQQTYEEAIEIDGRKSTGDFPFYAISKKTGERMLPVKEYLERPEEFMLAPKVLMLNNLENLVLPLHAINKEHIFARELMYGNEHIKANQIFCDDKWFEWISSFRLQMELSEEEVTLYGRKSITLAELHQSFSNETSSKTIYRNWLLDSTINSINQAKYPLLFLALLRDQVFYTEIPDFYKLRIT